MNYVAVGVAGIVGALLRYFIGVAIDSGSSMSFPLATLLINLAGCFALGWFTEKSSAWLGLPAWLKAGIGTGLIGAFTTFSTFSVETVQLAEDHLWAQAASYVLLSLWGGLLMAWLGTRAGGQSGTLKQKGLN
jgi:CrcB protein